MYLSTDNWGEKDNMIHSSVVSNGKTGEEWRDSFCNAYLRVGYFAQNLLLSDGFKPTRETTYHVVILKSDFFSKKGIRTTDENIRKKAEELGLLTPSLEIGCLIRKKLSNEDIWKMHLTTIVVMHDPVLSENKDLRLLAMDIRESEFLDTRMTFTPDYFELFAPMGETPKSYPPNYGFAFIKKINS
jgi:hypothetical protein